MARLLNVFQGFFTFEKEKRDKLWKMADLLTINFKCHTLKVFHPLFQSLQGARKFYNVERVGNP